MVNLSLSKGIEEPRTTLDFLIIFLLVFLFGLVIVFLTIGSSLINSTSIFSFKGVFSTSSRTSSIDSASYHLGSLLSTNKSETADESSSTTTIFSSVSSFSLLSKGTTLYVNDSVLISSLY